MSLGKSFATCGPPRNASATNAHSDDHSSFPCSAAYSACITTISPPVRTRPLLPWKKTFPRADVASKSRKTKRLRGPSKNFPIPWNALNITALCATFSKNDQKSVEASPSCDHIHRIAASADVNTTASAANPNFALFAASSTAVPPLKPNSAPFAVTEAPAFNAPRIRFPF